MTATPHLTVELTSLPNSGSVWPKEVALKNASHSATFRRRNAEHQCTRAAKVSQVR